MTIHRALVFACAAALVVPTIASAEPGSSGKSKKRWGKSGLSYRPYPSVPLLRDLPEGQVVESKVTRVHVFDGGARLERTARVTVQAGDHRLVFPALPANIQASTLGLSGFGANASAGSTFLESGTLVESRPKELLDLEKELERLTDQNETLRDRAEVLESRRALLLGAIASASSAPVPDLRARLDYAEEELTRTGREMTQIEAKQAVLAPQLAEVHKAYTDLRASLERPVKHVVVEVSSTEAATLDLTMRYLVTGPSWRPRHVARYDPSAGSLRLETYAWIVQQTPEPWSGVELALSTTRPVFGLRPPTSRTHFVGAVNGADLVAGEARALREVVSGGARLSEVERRSFSPTERVEIPSGSKGRRVLIHAVTLDKPKPNFHAVPAQSSSVYLSLTLKNGERQAWLPGEAALFNGSDYVGTATLPLVRAGEEITLPYGVDPAVTITRTRVASERRTEGKRQTLVASWAYGLKSQLPRPIRVRIAESLPVPRSAQVRVSADTQDWETGPKNGPKGLRYWWRDIPANGSKTWQLQVTVTASVKARIVGMN